MATVVFGLCQSGSRAQVAPSPTSPGYLQVTSDSVYDVNVSKRVFIPIQHRRLTVTPQVGMLGIDDVLQHWHVYSVANASDELPIESVSVVPKKGQIQIVLADPYAVEALVDAIEPGATPGGPSHADAAKVKSLFVLPSVNFTDEQQQYLYSKYFAVVGALRGHKLHPSDFNRGVSVTFNNGSGNLYQTEPKNYVQGSAFSFSKVNGAATNNAKLFSGSVNVSTGKFTEDTANAYEVTLDGTWANAPGITDFIHTGPAYHEYTLTSTVSSYALDQNSSIQISEDTYYKSERLGYPMAYHSYWQATQNQVVTNGYTSAGFGVRYFGFDLKKAASSAPVNGDNHSFYTSAQTNSLGYLELAVEGGRYYPVQDIDPLQQPPTTWIARSVVSLNTEPYTFLGMNLQASGKSYIAPWSNYSGSTDYHLFLPQFEVDLNVPVMGTPLKFSVANGYTGTDLTWKGWTFGIGIATSM